GLRTLPTLEDLRERLPGLVRQRLKLARAAGGGPRLYWQAVARSVGDQTGVFLGGLAGASGRNPVPDFVDRRLSGGV
ncbi:MAG: hypothetical protein ACRDTR_21025, partial [Rubrobacter sp.]